MIEHPSRPLSPEGEARLAKYGWTLDDQNVRLVAEQIADYPEIVAAERALDTEGQAGS